MWPQKAPLTTVREYGRTYLAMRETLSTVKDRKDIKEIINRMIELHKFNKKAISETGLPAKVCAGFVIPEQYEGFCV